MDELLQRKTGAERLDFEGRSMSCIQQQPPLFWREIVMDVFIYLDFFLKEKDKTKLKVSPSSKFFDGQMNQRCNADCRMNQFDGFNQSQPTLSP